MAEEGLQAQRQLQALIRIQRQRFAAAKPTVVPAAEPVDPRPFQEAEWASRKGEAPFWRPAKRKELRAEVSRHAEDAAAAAFAEAQAQQRQRQAEIDSAWTALISGQPAALNSVLRSAFVATPVRAEVIEANGDNAVLSILLPGLDVIPDRQPYFTPSGRLSSKAWTKTDLAAAYSAALGAHLVMTARLCWAVGPSLTHVRAIGYRQDVDGPSPLFDVDLERSTEQWEDDEAGEAALRDGRWGLRRPGRTHDVQAWPGDHLRDDVSALMSRS
jgi:hypothetical protein